MQVVLFGDGDIEPSKDNAMLLVDEACGLDLPMQLCQKLARLDFESRKDAAQAGPGLMQAWHGRPASPLSQQLASWHHLSPLRVS